MGSAGRLPPIWPNWVSLLEPSMTCWKSNPSLRDLMPTRELTEYLCGECYLIRAGFWSLP